MKLIDVISKLHELPDETFICARRPWTAQSDASLVPFTDDLGIPKEILESGFEYFLEVSTAHEILEGFLERRPLLEEIAEFVIYYAENDAFPK